MRPRRPPISFLRECLLSSAGEAVGCVVVVPAVALVPSASEDGA